ncbi:uncharacterized protein [Musca autumnalis]|uniref:uncharacterized protein n=1 Tax=Musca autumnalis TaxID=221902 RepID=UPI003CEF2121
MLFISMKDERRIKIRKMAYTTKKTTRKYETEEEITNCGSEKKTIKRKTKREITEEVEELTNSPHGYASASPNPPPVQLNHNNQPGHGYASASPNPPPVQLNHSTQPGHGYASASPNPPPVQLNYNIQPGHGYASPNPPPVQLNHSTQPGHGYASASPNPPPVQLNRNTQSGHGFADRDTEMPTTSKNALLQQQSTNSDLNYFQHCYSPTQSKSTTVSI